jgi:hypothetical protein
MLQVYLYTATLHRMSSSNNNTVSSPQGMQGKPCAQSPSPPMNKPSRSITAATLKGFATTVTGAMADRVGADPNNAHGALWPFMGQNIPSELPPPNINI